MDDNQMGTLHRLPRGMVTSAGDEAPVHAPWRVRVEVKSQGVEATRVHGQATAATTPDNGLIASLRAAASVIERGSLVYPSDLLDREWVEAAWDAA